LAIRIEETIHPVQRVLELGSGYGGLLRILKIKQPGMKFTLVDIPETLFLAHVYLRRGFPGAKFYFACSDREARDIPNDADFAFLPAQIVKALAGQRFDLVINTMSLSEMTQSAVDYYVGFVENDIETSWFYHLNRFGIYRGGAAEGLGNTCSTAYALDPNWAVDAWHWDDDDCFARLDGAWPAILDLVLKRVPPNVRSPELYGMAAGALEMAARDAAPGPPTWHRLMWDAVRYHRTPARLRTYRLAPGDLPQARVRRPVNTDLCDSGEARSAEFDAVLDNAH
jgi:SAM-dependent methyltransferase